MTESKTASKTKKQLLVAKRMADLLMLLRLSYGVGTRRSIDRVLDEWRDAHG